MSSRVRWLAAALAALAIPIQESHAEPDLAAWVVGGNDGSVTRVDLESGVVTPHFATVGFLPNRILADSSGAWAVVACSGSDDVRFLDLATGTSTSVALPPGANPWDVEIVGHRVFVTALLHDRVYVVDADTHALVGDCAVGKAPEGMCVAGGGLWVANTGYDFSTFSWGAGSVTLLDPQTLTALAVVPTDLNPQECVTTSEGRVHVICTGDFGATQGHVDVILPPARCVVGTLAVPGYPGTASVDPTRPNVELGVTTTAFGSEILSYEAKTLDWVHSHDDPLLPSFDFYGNLHVDERGELVVTDFAADLLLVESPESPGSPQTFLVGDGPIDFALTHAASPPTAVVASSAPTAVRLAIRAIAPNPSRADARIVYSAPRAGSARLEIFDVLGRRVLLRELGRVASGEGVLAWDGRGTGGSVVAPGLLLVRLTVGDATATERLVRLR